MSLTKTTIRILPETIRLVKMTDKEYFSSENKDYISNSKLGLINPDEGGSYEKYEQGFKSGYSDSFELGSAVHAIVLQPDYFNISDLRKPGGKLGLCVEKFYEYRRKGLSINESISLASADADYYKDKMTSTRLKTAIKSSLPFYLKRIHIKDSLDGIETIYLSETNAAKYEKCVLGIKSNPKVDEILYPKGLITSAEVYNEYAIFAEVEVTIDGKLTRLKLKAKLDNFTVNHETQEITLNDLKTTGKPINFFMGNNVTVKDEEGKYIGKTWYDGSFQKFHYYRQMGMYLWLLSCCMQNQGFNYKLKANMVVVETIPEFRTKVYPVTDKQIKQGLDEFKKLLSLVVEWIEKK